MRRSAAKRDPGRVIALTALAPPVLLGRGGSARAGDAGDVGDAGASTAPLSHPAESSRRCGRCPPSRRALIRPGRRLARAVEDGDVGRRAPNASEPCGLRRPAGSRRPVDNSLRILARRCLRSSSRSNSMQSQTVNYVRRVTVRCAVGTRKPQAWDPAMHSGGSRGPPGRWIVGTGSRRLECRDGAVVPSCGQCCG